MWTKIAAFLGTVIGLILATLGRERRKTDVLSNTPSLTDAIDDSIVDELSKRK